MIFFIFIIYFLIFDKDYTNKTAYYDKNLSTYLFPGPDWDPETYQAQ